MYGAVGDKENPKRQKALDLPSSTSPLRSMSIISSAPRGAQKINLLFTEDPRITEKVHTMENAKTVGTLTMRLGVWRRWKNRTTACMENKMGTRMEESMGIGR
jgi:hypothetical protein